MNLDNGNGLDKPMQNTFQKQNNTFENRRTFFNRNRQQNTNQANTDKQINPQNPQTTVQNGERQFNRPRPYYQNNFKPNWNAPRDNAKNLKNSEPKVKITFLGGVGEIGKNMTVFETDNDIIILDCGMSFPDSELPGVNVIVPDISYLLPRKDKIKAILITHGHEDHIGGLPYTLNDIKAPIYGSRFTLGLIDNKMREFPRIKYKAIEVKPRSVLKIGDFTIEFLQVNHSIAGALALCLTTPAGVIFHTGDFKIDNTPVDGKVIDLKRFEEIGNKGVNLLMCESTNVGRDGFSLSETSVGKVLDTAVFEKYTDKRLIISTFASNIHRLQQLMDLAEKHKRKVAFTGRSMLNVSEVGMKLGEIKFNRENVISIESIKKYADNELLIISTGSQGEPLSALTRMASDSFVKVKLTKNDCVVFSSSPIPGNEKSVYNVINKLVHKGIEVVYDKLADVHASGHAYKGEITTVFNLIKPKCFIPVHGEYLHLKQNKDLAMSLGLNERQIVLADIGSQIELTPNSLRHIGTIKAGVRLVDGNGLGDLASPVLKDRLQLADDGFIIAILNISNQTATLISDPLIITRGLLYMNEMDYITSELKTNLSVYIKNYDIKETDSTTLKTDLRKFVSNFISRKTGRRPITLVTTIFS